MKNLIKIISALSILFLFFFSCNSERDDMRINMHGKILNEINNKPLSNAKIKYVVKQTFGGSIFSSTQTDFSGIFLTDENGNFSVNLPYKSESNFFEFEIENIEEAKIVNKNWIRYSDLVKDNTFNLSYRNWEKLDVKILNQNPANENDRIEVEVLHTNTDYNFSPIQTIDNFGNKNDYIYPSENQTVSPFWIGSNVNSIIHCKVQNDSEITLIWKVTKNGINQNFSSKYLIKNGVLNSVNINY